MKSNKQSKKQEKKFEWELELEYENINNETNAEELNILPQ